MDATALLVAYVATTIAALLVSYFVIRLAVKHGTGSALRAHEVWMRDGGLERALDARAAAVLDQTEAAARTRAQMSAERH